MPDKRKVIVVGGGISGLTVAHELSQRDDFEVVVYERNAEFGGKARSVRFPDGNVGEHAMRGYMQPYSTLYGTMKEIPFDGGSVYDNLVYADIYMSAGGDEVLLTEKAPTTWSRMRTWWGIYKFFRRQGVPAHEILDFLYKTFRLLWMCEERQADELESISYQDYMDHENKSEAFRRTLLKIPDILTAAKPVASAYSVVGMLIAIFTAHIAKLDNRRTATSILNGPTNERFIDPWVEYLRDSGVTLHNNSRIAKVLHDATHITGVEIDGRVETADDFVIAVQHNVLDALITDDIEAMAPSLARLEPLGEEWSNGIQYFISHIPPEWDKYVGRATLVLDSPWSIVFMIKANREGSWRDVTLPAGTEGNLSLVFSNAADPGPVTGKTVKQCTRDELFAECIAQIHVDTAPLYKTVMSPDLEHLSRTYYEAHADEYAGFDTAYVASSDEMIVNDAPLYIATPGGTMIEPNNATEIPNLFVAGEFTRTGVPVPTMEGVNESGKKCAHAICDKYGLPYDATRYNIFELPFAVLRRIDCWLYRYVPTWLRLLLFAALVVLIVWWLL